jgi:hypothetical protein
LPVAAVVEAVEGAFVATELVAALALGVGAADTLVGGGLLATEVVGRTVAGADAAVLGPQAAARSTTAVRGKRLHLIA